MRPGPSAAALVTVALLLVQGGATTLAQSSEPVTSPPPLTLRVMSYNIYGGGQNDGKPIDETVAAIRAADPDIIGIQETRLESDPCTADLCPAAGPSAAQAIADALGMHVYEQTATNEALWANAILSRYPIGAASANDLGVSIDVDGHSVWMFNVHLDDSPYGPYQALDIPYGTAPFVHTADELSAFALATRGPALALLHEDMASAAGSDAVFVTGDFNEPSHLDWTQATVDAGQQPLVVAWPSAIAVESMGFVDAYRAVHPDPVADPAFTWTPTTAVDDPTDHHDRIDFVFARGETLTVRDAWIVGESADAAGIVVDPWPSDHRAVVVEVDL
jgi:endonuclease/exonuclease/phosphatase family metal-dependent hydrolase